MPTSPAALLRSLEATRLGYGPGPAAMKLALLRQLGATRLADARQVLRLHEHLCFVRAYPDSRAVLARVERMLAGSPEPERLGIAVAPARVARRLRQAVGLPERDGLLVREVLSDSVAARAGLAVGNLVVRLGDADVGSADELFEALAGVDGQVPVTVVRGAEELELQASFEVAEAGGDRG